MALDSTKCYYGPIDIAIKAGGTTNFTRSGLKSDALKFSAETKEGNLVLEDGSEKFWKEGRKLVLEITFQEMDPTATTGDLAKIESSSNDTIELTIREKSKKITISNPDFIVTNIDENFKTHIKIIKTGDLTKAWSDLMSIA
jgi:hypothetical protein